MYKRQGYIGDNIFSTGKIRYAAFCRAMSDAKSKMDKNLVELGAPNRQFGAEAASRLVRKDAGATAIIVTSVQTTLGAAEQLAAERVDVPGAISMIGYGDGDWHQWWGPGLTTLRLPVEDLSTTCGLWFLNSLQTGRWESSKESHMSMSSISLVVRGSTAPPSKSPPPSGAAARVGATRELSIKRQKEP